MNSLLPMPDWVCSRELIVLFALASFTMVVLALLPSRKPDDPEPDSEDAARRRQEQLKLHGTMPAASTSLPAERPASTIATYCGELGRTTDSEWRRARLRRYGALHQRRRHKDSPRRHNRPSRLSLALA